MTANEESHNQSCCFPGSPVTCSALVKKCHPRHPVFEHLPLINVWQARQHGKNQRWEINIPEIRRKGDVVPDTDWRKGDVVPDKDWRKGDVVPDKDWRKRTALQLL